MHDDNLDPTTLPLDEQTALMGRDSTRLDIAERELNAARTAYQAHVINGNFADIPEVRERLEALYGTPLRGAEEAAVRLAQSVAERARGVATATASARPKLSAGETVEAGAFAAYAEADCRDLPISDLLSEIRGVVVANDRARMFAYSRFIGKRLAPVAGDLGSYQRDPAANEKAELRRLLGVINERLADPAFVPVRNRATELSARASAVGHDAGTRAREAYRATHPYAFQSPGDVQRDRG